MAVRRFFIFLTRGLESFQLKQLSPLTSSIISFVIFFAFGNLMYFTRQWGGGDTKLITALGTALAQKPFFLTKQSIFPFPAILIINIPITGAIYGIIYALILAIRNKKEFKKSYIKINQNKKIRNIKILLLTFTIILAIFSYIILPGKLKLIGGLISALILTLPYLLISIKSVETSCMFKQLKPTELREGDWVQNNLYQNKKLIYKKNPYGIDQISIEKVKKAKIKKILVKEGIPFVPPFLLGTIITLIYGKIIFIPLI